MKKPHWVVKQVSCPWRWCKR